ncbi:MAG: ATP-binding protein [Bacteroidia bacterium]|jgi:hypothetical protein|nr:ATP-binding protein [Bacteroidia bacterium]
MILQNPFADYGGIVVNDRFVGRKKEIENIQNRLLGSTYGNIAVVGLPRVGKSSLVWNSIIAEKDKLLSKNILPIWISFGEYDSLYETFEDIIFEIDENFNNTDLSDNLKVISEKIGSNSSIVVKRRFIKRYFKFLKQKGYRIIVALDEFDNAKNILNLQEFQFLRELSYNIETKIGLITISRKSIQELEPDNGALSNFYQIFSDLRLKLFSENDIDIYWKRIENYGIEISANYKEKVNTYCGKHPYLLDVLNHEIFNRISQSGIDLNDTFLSIIDELRLKLFNEYEAILKLMTFEGLGDKLLQMVVGPVYDISQRDTEKLLKYDIVNKCESGNYSSFSSFFNDYLFLKSSSIDMWPLWTAVENEVRSIIKLYLLEEFGDNWEIGFENKFKQKKAGDFLDSKRDIQIKNKASFGDKASEHLVDYTYPMDMFDRFIAADWIWFSKVFGNQKNDWKPIFQHLGKIRNPLAHNNPQFLSDSDKNLAEGYCKIILDKIAKWKQKEIN